MLNGAFLDDRLYAIAGVRRSQSEASSFNRRTNTAGTDFDVSRTSTQFGGGYKVLPSLLVFGSYSESFTPANTLLSFNGVPAGPAKPVTSDGVEFGVKTDFFNGRLSSTMNRVQSRFDYVEFDDQRCRIIEIHPVDADAVRDRPDA